MIHQNCAAVDKIKTNSAARFIPSHVHQPGDSLAAKSEDERRRDFCCSLTCATKQKRGIFELVPNTYCRGGQRKSSSRRHPHVMYTAGLNFRGSSTEEIGELYHARPESVSLFPAKDKATKQARIKKISHEANGTQG